MRGALLFALILTYRAEKTKTTEIQCNWNPNNTNETNATISYLNAQLWKVIVDTDKKSTLIKMLENTGDLQNWDLNDGTYYDIFVEAQYLRVVSKLFDDNNVTYKVATTDFQKWINEANPPSNESHAGHNLSWARYHRLSDIESFIDYLVRTHPSLCTVKTIGTSIEGRLLRVLKISNGRPRNKAVWIDGGIHGREWISPATVTYIIKHLVENWENETKEIRNIDWHFVPVLNPDGYEFAHTRDRLWRKNRRQNGSCPGTDLNRNFGSNWGEPGTSRCPCHDVYGGSGPFSEPESRAVMDYVTVSENRTLWKAYMSFHSYGQVIYHAGVDLKTIGDQMAQQMQSACGTVYKLESSITPGGSDNWAKNMVGMKYAYTVELRDLGKYGFILPAINIKPSGEEGLATVRVVANAIRNF